MEGSERESKLLAAKEKVGINIYDCCIDEIRLECENMNFLGTPLQHDQKRQRRQRVI